MPGVVFLYYEIIQFWKGVYYIIRTAETGKVALYLLVFHNEKGLQSFERNMFQISNIFKMSKFGLTKRFILFKS